MRFNLDFLKDHEGKPSFTRTMGYYLFWYFVLFTVIYLVRNDDISINFIAFSATVLGIIFGAKVYSQTQEIKKKLKNDN